MTRLTHFFARLGAGAALLAALEAPAAPVASRPNILFIMSDDHAAHAISAYGSRINRTPQIDRLAADGMLFTRCFANNSICTPSRAAILTGKYSHLNGVTVFNRFDGSQPHVGKYLQQAGYQTALIGKWHLFSEPTGFDYWRVLPGQGRYHDPQFLEPGRTNVIKGYATDIITDLSIAWLQRRDPTKPFFLCTHHKAPHREWTPAAKYTNLYEDIEVPYPVTFDDDYRGRSSAAAEATMRMRDLTRTDLKRPIPPGLSEAEEKRWRYQRYIKDYLRCIASVDDSVGRLLDYLDQSGLRTNTLVIYTSDQGFFLGDHGWFDKRFMYEESLRMPFLVSLPGRIPAATTNAAMILNVDFAPTFLELAGLPVPPDMQGRSLMPLLEGRTPGDWRTSIYYRYYHYPAHHRVQPHLGVRTDRYKLIHFNRLDQWELYDLHTDPYETNNLYANPAHAGTVQTLRAELARLKKELKDDDQHAEVLSDGEAIRPVALELALRYDFSKLSEGRVPDASGKGHAGQAVQAQRVQGLKADALRLDGQGHVVVADGARSFDPSNRGFTVGAWCRPEKPDGVLVSWGGSAQGFSLYLKDATPRLALRSGGQLFEVSAKTKLPLNEWSHLTGVLHNNGNLQLLINAQPGGAAKAQGIQSKPREGLTLGADPGSTVGSYAAPLSWHGLIEDARLYWGQLDQDALQDWAARPARP
jgi:arylsulfatase A-like enzyme